MIFDHRPLDKISDKEIDALVTNHEKERQHLEFRATIELKNKNTKKNAKLETLRDIASLANGGGGYLIVGVSDDGGHAGRYSKLTFEDAENIRKFLISICQEHIRERIQYLEADARNIKNHAVLIVRIPPSHLTPHMVKIDHKTDFWTRHDDGKKEMTYGEIRREFRKDRLDRRLARMENQLRDIQEALKRFDAVSRPYLRDLEDTARIEKHVPSVPAAGSTMEDIGEANQRMATGGQPLFQSPENAAVSERQVMKPPLAVSSAGCVEDGRERIASGTQPYVPNLGDSDCVQKLSELYFKQTVGDSRYFRIAVTPVEPKDNSLHVGSTEILSSLESPPDTRYAGWDIGVFSDAGYRAQRFGLGICIGEKAGGEYLELWTNGHMEFWAPIDDAFCWRQSKEELAKNPMLFPYAVCEFPVSLMRLYRHIVETSGIKDYFEVQVLYLNIRGVRLRKGRPGTYGYELDSNPKSFGGSEYNNSVTAESDFAPDEVAHELIKAFYAEFGH